MLPYFDTGKAQRLKSGDRPMDILKRSQTQKVMELYRHLTDIPQKVIGTTCQNLDLRTFDIEFQDVDLLDGTAREKPL